MHAPSGEKSFAPCLVCLWFTHSLFLPPSHSDLLATRACTLSPSRPGSLCTTAGPWQSNFASPDPPLQGSARGNTRKFAALLLPLLLGAIRVKPNSPSWIITVRVVETLMMTMRVMMPWACPGLTQMMMIFLLERMIVEMTVTSHSMTLGVNETFFFLFFFLRCSSSCSTSYYKHLSIPHLVLFFRAGGIRELCWGGGGCPTLPRFPLFLLRNHQKPQFPL